MWLCYCRYAVLGVHPGQGQSVKISDQPVIFKDKDENNNEREHDIMLLKLPSPAPTNIQPVELPDCNNPPKRRILFFFARPVVQVAGYGVTNTGPNKERSEIHFVYLT